MLSSRRTIINCFAALILTAGTALAQTPLGSGFTYQGRIALDGTALDGTADFQFTLWDAATSGNQVGATLNANGVNVVDGVFTVELDFGILAFNGDARWLEIAVASPSGGALSTLDPRQPLTAAPYALQTRGIVVDDSGNVSIGTSGAEASVQIEGALQITTGGVSGLEVQENVIIDGVVVAGEFYSLAASPQLRFAGPTSDQISLDIGKNGDGDFVVEFGDTPNLIVKRDGTVTASAFAGDGSALTNLPGVWNENAADIYFDTGKVGIGTTDPIAMLHVAGGDILVDRGQAVTGVTRTLTLNGARQYGGTEFAAIDFGNYDDNATQTDYVGARIGSQNTGSSDQGDLSFYTKSESDPDPVERLTVTPTGDVGIGISSPATELEVDGTVTATAFVGDGSGLTNLPIMEGVWDENGSSIYYDAGDVGIGTSSPSSALDVVGTVTATSFVGDGSGLTNVRLASDTAVITAWGSDYAGQVSETPGGPYVAVAGGYRHNVAIAPNGTLVSWGLDDEGQVSDTPVGGSFVAVAAGYRHNVAIASDGSLVSWGCNLHGEVSDTPTDGSYVAVAAGDFHSVALASDGSLDCWGRDDYGQVSGTPSGSFVAVAAGGRHNVALRSDGTLVSWGSDFGGETSDTPMGGSYVAVTAGTNHSVAIASDGSLVSWGWNEYGQVSGTPMNGSYVAVAAGTYHSVALRSDGLLVSWGSDPHGQISGAPTSGSYVAVTSGYHHSLALQEVTYFDGEVITGDLHADGLYVDDSVGIGRNPAANKLEVEGNASKSAAGDWLANSDRRIKTNIETITDALGTLDRVRLVSFEYTEDYQASHAGVGDGRYLNVIAQEFAQVFPDHVKGSGERLPDGSEILQVDTYPLTIYSAAAIQELRAENRQLRAEKDAELAALRTSNEQLVGRLARLEALVEKLTSD